MGCRVNELIFSGLASASILMFPEERGTGACVLDIGAETTDYIVYFKNRIVLAGSIPVGGRHFTNDLCSGLHLHFEDAEQLKKKEGLPDDENESLEEEIWAIGSASIGDKKFRRKSVKTILQARAEELFMLFNKNLENHPQIPRPTSLILTGGGSQLKNMEKCAGYILQMDVARRKPLYPVSETLENPAYATCLGLLKSTFDSVESQCPKPKKTLRERIAEFFYT
jgi:cell division protein FtsA